MKLEYEVHSVSHSEMPMTVKIDGKDREVRSDVLVVELVKPGSALSISFDDVEAAEKLFESGKKVTLTFAGVK